MMMLMIVVVKEDEFEVVIQNDYVCFVGQLLELMLCFVNYFCCDVLIFVGYCYDVGWQEVDFVLSVDVDGKLYDFLL